jgi:hypothetical protein
MPSSSNSVTQLQRALALAQQIERLEGELAAVLGTGRPSSSAAPRASAPAVKQGKGRKRGTISPEGRARIIAAQKARWAKVRREKGSGGSGATAAKSGKKKGGLTAEGRARLAALMKARWAARRRGASAPNASRRK